jgi:hypothetical protein
MHMLRSLAATLLLSVSALSGAAPPAAPDLLSRVDHLVYATPDLARGVAEIERLLGVRAVPGGQHPGRGTRNALVALGPRCYLEIIGPDPDQPPPQVARHFGIDELRQPRLAGWAANGTQLRALREDAVRNGIPLGEVGQGSRRRPDGLLLSWDYTDSRTVVAEGVVPFFIDWGRSPHPALTAAGGARLVSLRAEHPDAGRVRRMLDTLSLPLPVAQGPAARLIAVIDTPHGRVELR